MEADIDTAAAEGKINDAQHDTLHGLLSSLQRAVKKGDRSPSTAAREVADALTDAIKSEEKLERAEQKTEREEANEAIQLAQRRGKQFLDALRAVNSEYSEYVALQDAPVFRRLLESLAQQVNKLAEAGGWEAREEAA